MDSKGTPKTQRLTLMALGAVVLLFAVMIAREAMLLALGQSDPFSGTVDFRLTRVMVLSGVTLVGAVALWMYWRGREIGARIAVLVMTLALPVVFEGSAFDGSIPQGFWIPFLMALTVGGLRWALLTLALSVGLVVLAYPHAWGSPAVAMSSLIVLVLLFTARLIQQELLESAEHARREAQRAERSMHESESRYRLLVEESPLAIQALSPDGRILRVNEAWCRLWGTTLEAARHYRMLEDPQLRESGVLPLLERALCGERVELPTIEYDAARNGLEGVRARKLWVRTFAYPVHGEDGALRELVLIQEDVSERVQAESQIRDLAFFDSLTHLPNRRLLMDRLNQSLIGSARSHEFGALLILDLDNFKTLNDSQGHDIGDQLLIEVARRLTGTMRHQDTVARLGGDEFVVILEGMGVTENAATAHVEQIGEKVRAAILEPCQLQGLSRSYAYHGTTSIGVALFHGRAVPAESLLKHADVALYQAKAAGRNAMRFFNATMQAAIDSRTSLEVALRAALENGEFELHYQPQVDTAGTVIGVEALLRWRSPQRGLVAPGEFIPLAEDTALILPIGRWVLETACAQLRAWAQDPRTQQLSLSVNVSARQVLQPDFVDVVERTLQASGAEPARLKLELTESVVLEDLEGVIEKLRRLRALGVDFALDDFGTGYSSLSYLKRLPLQQIKIDQTFVRDIETDPNDSAIVRAILAMSLSLGLQVIAEGVETAAQRDFLQRNGCEAFQGYFFARPMRIADLQNLLLGA